MAKVRVHELAKEFNLENKEVLDKLRAAGLVVKTHSSSVYADEGRAALKGSGVEQQDAPEKKRRPGMMIRKKKKADLESEAVEVSAESEESVEVSGTDESTSAVDAPVAEASPVVEAESVVEPPVTEEPSASEVAPIESPQEGEEAAAAAVAVEPVAETPVPSAKDVEAKPITGVKSKPGGARVVRMIDREKLLERVPSRRLGTDRNGGGHRPSQGPGGNRTGIKKKLNEVTELRVVSDPFGRGREMVQVGKDRKGPGGKAKKKVRGGGGKRDGMGGARERSMLPSRLRRKKGARKSSNYTQPATQPKEAKRVVKMKETIVLAELAHQLGVKATDLIRKLMDLGTMVTQNQSIDFETAQVLASEYTYRVESIAFKEEEYIAEAMAEEGDENLEPRAPVVTIMGHVDHGKTSLLDAIRKARVASGEAGGITQHIGAYSVTLDKGKITFIDTPGHAAFTEMRARGAQATDIVILVVAADDGVMPQTEEAIRHAQAAGVPIIVAVNKCDLAGANPEKVTQELAAFDLLPEAWGGDTLYINTSATQGTGLGDLLESILLQAEMLELKANPKREAAGIVLEAQLDKGRGPVATILVQQGTLKRGAFVVVGEYAGKIRAMTNYTGKPVKAAGPSEAVEIIGLEGVPRAGDKFNAVASAEAARGVSEHRVEQRKESEKSVGTKMSLEQLMSKMKGEEKLDLKLILKADVQGSLEALKGALLKLATDEVGVSVVYGGVGGIKESDIMLAAASEGLILGFNVRPDTNARRISEREGVEIRTYNIIYEIVDDVKKAMEGLLAPESKENVVGRAEVRDLFRVSKIGLVAGCRVVDGKAIRAASVRVLRDSIEVYSGKVGSLFHFKDAVREVDSGSECGVSVQGFADVKVEDVFEFFTVEEVSRTLDFSHANN